MNSQKYLKYFPKFLRQDLKILLSLLSALIINIIVWFALLGKFGVSGEPAPLHFSVVYGINYVGPSYQVYQLPLAGLVIISLNWYLGKIIYPRTRLPAYFLTFAALFAQFIFLLAALSLIFLNR